MAVPIAADTSSGSAPHLRLRAATAAAHDQVDAAYSRFDLTDRSSYGAFLTAHAYVLPAVEAALSKQEAWSSFLPRTPALQADLVVLGLPIPPRIVVPVDGSSAAIWGTIYVSEGSRLGGIMLSRRVPDDLPRSYLSAAHGPGDWRRLLTRFDHVAACHGPEWVEQAITAARRTFEVYAAAADLVLCGG